VTQTPTARYEKVDLDVGLTFMAGCFATAGPRRGPAVYLQGVGDNRSSEISDLGEGKMVRSKTAADERKRRDAERELRQLDRRSDQQQRNFETTMAAIAAFNRRRKQQVGNGANDVPWRSNRDSGL
jgi:hypothetical protein